MATVTLNIVQHIARSGPDHALHRSTGIGPVTCHEPAFGFSGFHGGIRSALRLPRPAASCDVPAAKGHVTPPLAVTLILREPFSLAIIMPASERACSISRLAEAGPIAATIPGGGDSGNNRRSTRIFLGSRQNVSPASRDAISGGIASLRWTAPTRSRTIC